MSALILALIAAQPSMNLNLTPIESRQNGARLSTQRQYAIDCRGGVACSVDGGALRIWSADAGAASSSGPPVDGGFVLWGGSVGSTNERTLSAGNYTVIDNATPAQTQVDWQHGLTCAANERLTTLGTTAMTCSQVAFSDLSGSATTGQLPTIPVTKGGTNLTTIAANQTWVGTAADTVTAKTLPSCSNATTSKLLYDNATQTFSCGTDQSGAGNFVEVEVDFGASGNDTASTVVTTATWVGATSKIICAPTMLATTDRAEGVEDALIEDIDVAIHTRVAGTGFTLTAHAGLGKAYGKFIYHCTGG